MSLFSTLKKLYQNLSDKSFWVDFLFNTYRTYFRPTYGMACKHSPSCSQYARKMFLNHNAFYAFGAVLIRLLRCNPFTSAQINPHLEIK